VTPETVIITGILGLMAAAVWLAVVALSTDWGDPGDWYDPDDPDDSDDL
jgi:hypothetical protein